LGAVDEFDHEAADSSEVVAADSWGELGFDAEV